MPRRAQNNPRQIRNKACGCKLCLEEYPGNRKARRDCIGSWQARYRGPDGRQKAKNFEKEKEALAFLDKTRTDVRQGTYLDPKRGEITVTEWHAKWWETQKKKGRPTTRARKVGVWTTHIKPQWGDWKINGVGFIEFDAWLQNDVKGFHTRKKVLEFMRRMMQAAILDKRITSNCTFGVELEAPPAKHPDDLAPPTDEQCAKILAHIPAYYHPLLTIADETGMRWGEYTGLRLCHVDRDAATARVVEVISEDEDGKLFRQEAPKTNAGFRTVPLTPAALAAVEAMVARWSPSEARTGPQSGMHAEELVFVGPRRGVLSRHNFRRVWIKAIQEAGVARKVLNTETGRMEWWPRPHDYRHRFASRLKDAGVPEKDVQAIMGHDRGSSVTWLYQHAGPEVVESVRDALVRRGKPQLRAVS
ncbi:tyrosine-type recombinase/integrase [Kitasatospora sp. NPDC127116]|uniref:tyrosine-type recombinase/integrase n=1 Tax=Kitasatospora sp. NPDC127116 TaxID=3345367 RepID=UPI00362EB77B